MTADGDGQARFATLEAPFTIPLQAGATALCRGVADPENCPAEQVETSSRFDTTALRAKLSELLVAGEVGDDVKVLVAPADSIDYLHVIHTLDAVLRSCAGEGEDKRCLRNPSLGDIGLLRSRGFSDL